MMFSTLLKFFTLSIASIQALSIAHQKQKKPVSDPADVAQPSDAHADDPPAEPWKLPLMKTRRPRHTLRICNAYPFDKPLRILLNDAELYGGMTYKECDDFVNMDLLPGDTLRFKIEVDHHEHNAGIFEIAEVPHYASTLLLVVSRHDVASNAVAFESHVFRASDNAQIAVVDTFRGKKARVRIMHADEKEALAGPEELPFGSVHKINSGVYDILMDEGKVMASQAAAGGQEGQKEKIMEKPIVVLPTHDYVVLRVGIDDPPEPEDGEQEGSHPIPGDMTYPEDCVVFPLSDAARLNPPAKSWWARIFG